VREARLHLRADADALSNEAVRFLHLARRGVFDGTASYISIWLASIDKAWFFHVYLIMVALLASVIVPTWKNSTGKPMSEIS
jgi:hypothetical protein